jgi:hypothetical protein
VTFEEAVSIIQKTIENINAIDAVKLAMQLQHNLLYEKMVNNIELQTDAMQKQAEAIKTISEMIVELLVALADTAVKEKLEVK